MQKLTFYEQLGIVIPGSVFMFGLVMYFPDLKALTAKDGVSVGELGLFVLLAAEANAAMQLTESFAMLPASAVSGFYLSHPDAAYFAVGKLGRDQVEDYARRKGMSVEDAERWLAPNLGYEPADIISSATT